MSTSEDRYRLTLELWAAQHIPPGHVVTGVVVRYDDGYDPTFTDRPMSLDVGIIHRDPTREGSTDETDITDVVTSIGELLTALFTIEETP